jgi:hypothetical protein
MLYCVECWPTNMAHVQHLSVTCMNTYVALDLKSYKNTSSPKGRYKCKDRGSSLKKSLSYID